VSILRKSAERRLNKEAATTLEASHSSILR